jgi:hypothetical protein
MAFTYIGDLSSALDYARWRLDDTREDAPFLQDETYTALFERFGVREGMAQAAGTIAVILSKKITSFGESAGIRFSKRNLDYYESLPDIIRREPAYESSGVTSRIRLGRIATGHSDTLTATNFLPFMQP